MQQQALQAALHHLHFHFLQGLGCSRLGPRTSPSSVSLQRYCCCGTLRPDLTHISNAYGISKYCNIRGPVGLCVLYNYAGLPAETLGCSATAEVVLPDTLWAGITPKHQADLFCLGGFGLFGSTSSGSAIFDLRKGRRGMGVVG